MCLFFKSLYKCIHKKTGNSIAEFAVVTAMMATLIATAMPKYSDVMEYSKYRKAEEEMDKILAMAKNFYQTTGSEEGRGRFPGQDKYNMAVGGYLHEIDLINGLDSLTTYSDQEGKNWCSIFGINNEKSPMNEDSYFVNDTLIRDENCQNCPESRMAGHEAWLHLFGDEPLISPFQDGHFIYAVIPGSGTGDDADSPVLYIADGENPRDFYKMLKF